MMGMYIVFPVAFIFKDDMKVVGLKDLDELFSFALEIENHNCREGMAILYDEKPVLLTEGIGTYEDFGVFVDSDKNVLDVIMFRASCIMARVSSEQYETDDWEDILKKMAASVAERGTDAPAPWWTKLLRRNVKEAKP